MLQCCAVPRSTLANANSSQPPRAFASDGCQSAIVSPQCVLIAVVVPRRLTRHGWSCHERLAGCACQCLARQGSLGGIVGAVPTSPVRAPRAGLCTRSPCHSLPCVPVSQRRWCPISIQRYSRLCLHVRWRRVCRSNPGRGSRPPLGRPAMTGRGEACKGTTAACVVLDDYVGLLTNAHP